MLPHGNIINNHPVFYLSHADDTHFYLFISSQSGKNCIDDVTVIKAEPRQKRVGKQVRILGIVLDADLNLENHKNFFLSLKNLSKVRRFLSETVSVTWVGVLSAGLLWGSRQRTDSLLLIDGFPEGLGHLGALQPVDNLKVCTYVIKQSPCNSHQLLSLKETRLTWVNSSKVSWSLVLVSSWMISRTLYPGRARLETLKSSLSSSLLMNPLLSTSDRQSTKVRGHRQHGFKMDLVFLLMQWKSVI